ncbi:MAG: ArsR family transcriptional regulator [Desulfurococcales archaeon]|nr:ArsR family transcriptional regulator [Desulfurococcales archaeon]
MDIEEVFGSRGRIRVFKYLLEEGYANISRIARETRLHYKIVRKYLEEFKALGLVEERRYGRLRIYALNLSDPRIGALKDLLRELERI